MINDMAQRNWSTLHSSLDGSQVQARVGILAGLVLTIA